MKFRDIVLFTEQNFDINGFPVDDEGDPLDADGNLLNPNDLNGEDIDDPEIDDNGNEIPPFQPGDPGDRLNPRQPARNPERPVATQNLSAAQQIKMKWKKGNPGLTDFQAAEAIAFFRDRRETLRPYRPYGFIDPATNRHYINTPEITSLVERFPFMESTLSDQGKMLDLKNYTWEVMEFYIHMVQTVNTIVNEETHIPGLNLPIEQQLDQAKQKWTNSRNQIINEGGLICYKIESKNESIEFGSIQRVLNKMRKERGDDRGNSYWCTTVPLNDKNRSNLWTNYRPHRGFYYLWDRNKEINDRGYAASIQITKEHNIIYVDLYNKTTDNHSWEEMVEKHPQLEGKEHLFKHFGITEKEKDNVTIDKISFNPSSAHYFGTIPASYRLAYVDDGRHVNDVKAFLTMDPATRKLYVDKTTIQNNDVQTRFLCNDPNNPFGILNILRLETKPEDLYKLLDVKILKVLLKIPDGVRSIKKTIIGANWKGWLMDDEKQIQLISPRSGNNTYSQKTAYGVINVSTGELDKDPQYIKGLPKAFVEPYLNEDGKIMRDRRWILEKYSFRMGDGRMDQNEGFYFLFRREALNVVNKNDKFYLKGKYFEIDEGENYINELLTSGKFIKI